MSLFEVMAKIGLDTSGYEKGLDGASKLTSKFGSTLNSKLEKVKKAASIGFKAATAAATAFGVSSIKTGMDFDSAMSQVAATMGKTTDEIKDLRAFAQKMGESTKFSATEAANALNYMALAGYDSEKAMAMLPNVLNLAAAGGIDLASASDMVTDAQSALGLSMKQTNKMVDQMAAASSKSNTSVAQLGEAILTVGGTAKSLKGGTVELSTALGLLADNGVKGAEGGTALRNIILSLSAPTDKAAKTMKNLGLEVFDAEGNMRPLNDVFGDLNGILGSMTGQQKTEVLNELFNKVDLKSVNALLGTNVERWDELSTSIKKSKGAADAMAKTQLDNLSGDLTILKSAFEGLQIAVSDKVSPALRKFVQAGTDGISELTTAVKSGDLGNVFNTLANDFSKAADKMETVGGTIVDNIISGIDKYSKQFANNALYLVASWAISIREKADKFVDAGLKLAESMANGLVKSGSIFSKAVPTIITNIAGIVTDNAPKIVTSLTNGIQKHFPKLVETALNAAVKLSEGLRNGASKLVDAGLKLIMSLADGLIKNIPTLIKTVPTIISNLAGIINDNAPKLLAAGATLIVKLAKGIIDAIPTLVKEFPKIIKAVVDVWTAFNWLSLGKTAITAIKNGISNFGPKIVSGLKDIGSKAINAFKNVNWAAVGKTVITFLKNAITTAGNGIVTVLKAIGTKGINAFKSVNWAAVGKAVINFIANAIRGAANLVITGLRTVATQAMNAFKSLDWKSIGLNVIKGIAAGITGGVSTIASAAKEAASSALNAAKDFLGIHSPSKEAEKQIGLPYVQGIAEGIRKNKDYVEKSAQEVGEAILQESEKQLNNTKVYKDVSLKQEAAYWNAVRKQVKKGTQARIDADAKYFEAKKAYTEKIKEQEKEQNEAALTAWESATVLLRGTNGKVIDSSEKLYASIVTQASKLKTLAKKAGQDYNSVLLSAAEKRLSNAKLTRDVDLQEEAEYWNKIRKQIKKGTQERIDADAKYADSLKSYREAIKKTVSDAKTLASSFAQSFSEINESLEKSISDVEKKYADALSARADGLTSSISLFEQFKKADLPKYTEIVGIDENGEKVTREVTANANMLLNNLQDQVKAIHEWNSILDNLTDRLGGSNPLLKQFESMGVNSYETLALINDMTDEQLQTYVNLYNQYAAEAMNRAKRENEDLKEQTKTEVEQLKEDARQKIEALKAQFEKDLKQLAKDSKSNGGKVGESITKGVTKGLKDTVKDVKDAAKAISDKVLNTKSTAKTSGTTIGQSIASGMEKGLRSGQSSITSMARQVAMSALNAAKNALGVHSPSTEFAWIGKMVDQGLANGIAQNSNKVDSAMDNLARITQFPTTSSIQTATARVAAPSGGTTNITMNIYGAQGQDVKALADEVERRLNNSVNRGLAAYA